MSDEQRDALVKLDNPEHPWVRYRLQHDHLGNKYKVGDPEHLEFHESDFWNTIRPSVNTTRKSNIEHQKTERRAILMEELRSALAPKQDKVRSTNRAPGSRATGSSIATLMQSKTTSGEKDTWKNGLQKLEQQRTTPATDKGATATSSKPSSGRSPARFFVKKGDTVSWLSSSQLKAAVANGEFAPDDLIRKSEKDNWTKLSNVKGLDFNSPS